MTVPGKRVMHRDRYDTICLQEKIMSEVLDACMTLPFKRHMILTLSQLRSVTI